MSQSTSFCTSQSLFRPRILVVDDEAEMHKLYDMVFRNWDYEAVHANNGLEALTLLMSDTSIRGVVSDFQMPKMNGIQLYHAAQEAGYKGPFVFLSATQDIEYPAPVLQKGYDMKDLRPFLDKHFL